jgi:conjugal transfer ATP-binding protein TraC
MGLLERNVRAVLERERFSRWLPYIAYEDGLYLLDDGSFGFGFDCQPIPSAGSETARLLEDLYTIPQLPPDTFINVFLYASPRIGPLVKEWVRGKKDPLFEQLAWERAKYYAQGAKEALFPDIGYTVRDFRLLITFRIPGPPKRTWKTLLNTTMARQTAYRAEEVLRIKEACKGGLSIAGLFPQELRADVFISFMQSVLNPSHALDDIPRYDPAIPVRDQMVFADTAIQRLPGSALRLDQKILKILTIKQYPTSMHLSSMNDLVGDLMQRTKQLSVPFAYSFTIRTLDQETARNDLRRKSALATYQSMGPLANFLPSLSIKKQYLDLAVHGVERDGKHLMNISFALFIMAPSVDEAEKATRMANGLLKLKGFTPQEEDQVIFPVLISMLPMGMTVVREDFLHRAKTVLSHNAAHLSPVQGDWKGTGPDRPENPSPMILLSRRGQVMLIDFYASPTNYNATILATSGSGKSVLANELCVNYLSIGSKIWVIDIGRSYKKLCEWLNGEFIQFNDDTPLVLNPFTNIATDKNGQILLDEMELLVSLVANMSCFQRAPTDLEKGYIENAINLAFKAKGREATITTIAEMLDSQFEDQRAKDIAQMLYPFTKHGRYARYFEGPSSLNFKSNFVVLELEELQGKPALLSVVLVNLMSRIGQAMYLGDRGTKKIVLMDEAHTLLSAGVSGEFIIQGYRRYRKYSGSAIVISQSINDLYKSEAGRVASENSEWTLLLRQKSESLELLRESKRLMLPDWWMELLKSVHKDGENRYSEVCVYSSSGVGIGRLVLDDSSYFLYTSVGQEVKFIEECRARGMTMIEAIAAARQRFPRTKHILTASTDDILPIPSQFAGEDPR